MINSAEGLFGVFKRGMTGVYQHCSEGHLQRYNCGFRRKAAGDSDPFQPLIPTQTSHRFRSKPATPLRGVAERSAGSR